MLLFASVLLSISLVCSIIYRQRLRLSLGAAPNLPLNLIHNFQLIPVYQ
ncbi:MAG: hypothetical protein LVT47_11535 [Cyanobacteria bacterium LVE1205-1]|jgi:hypothetical protein